MKTYIIHVSTASDRRKLMEKELAGKNLNVEFIYEGDKNELTPEILNTYFKGEMHTVIGGTSCAFKHILAAEKIMKGQDDYALILEDDIFFYQNFSKIMDEIKVEIQERELSNFLISLEDSILKYIEKSKRSKFQHIYKKSEGRLAGAYILDKKAAASIYENAISNKIDVPIDWFHNVCAKQQLINIYWLHPTICCQRSHNGTMPSLIDKKAFNLRRRIGFILHKKYKEILYSLR